MNGNRRSLRHLGAVWALLLLAVTLAGPGPARAGDAPSPTQLSVPTRLEGQVTAIGADKWLVDGRSVLVNAGILLVEKRGKAEVGAWVIVWGTRDDQGSVHAELIQVDRPAGRSGAQIQFTGVVRKVAGNWWIIEQNLVEVNSTTTIVGEPQIGSFVWVVAEQHGDAYRATVIQLIAADPTVQAFEFEGVIERFDANSWDVDGYHLTVTPDTLIYGEPEVGKKAEVRAQPGAGGELIALLLRVIDSASQARLSALVTGIMANQDGSQTWNLLMFPQTTDELPVAGELQVTGSTYVDESHALAQAGQWVEVTGSKTETDAYQADVIHLARPMPVTLEGDLIPLSTKPGARGWWLLNGQPVWWLPPSTSAAAALAGDPVAVSGVRLGNGVIWVKQIREAQSPVH